MKAMLDSPIEYATPRGRVYRLGSVPAKGGGAHRVALALADQGTAVAAYRATLLSEDFPEVSAILMVGIAGGVPDIHQPERHVRLGDIVASGEAGVIAYDFVKEHSTSLEPRHPPRPPHAGLYQACRRLEAGALEGEFPWLAHARRAAHLPHAARPPSDSDRLADTADPARQVDHPADPARRSGVPRVFIGTVACANRLLKNPVHRDQIRDDFDVRAVEMEGFGIAEATWNLNLGYLIVRGICDYCDSFKGNPWQGHAAIIAAAFARAVLEETPPLVPRDAPAVTREVRIESVPESDLHDLARALLVAGTPPAVGALFPDASVHVRRALGELERTNRTLTALSSSQTTVAGVVELAAAPGSHHMFVAPPGSGKTHALWHGAHALLAAGRAVPLYLPTGGAATWQDVVRALADIAGGCDAPAILRDPRVCVLLDGWSEFEAGKDSGERTRAMQVLHGTKVISNGRRGTNLDPHFQVWELDALPRASVTRAIRAALPQRSPPVPDLAELLRLPLALSLYLFLGGSATTRGELLATFHDHLSRGFPDAFRQVLAGAVAATTLASHGRSRARFDEELRERAERADIRDARALLEQLGTLDTRAGAVVPVHDLYWSWLAGVGLLAENRIVASLPALSTRESLEVALESGVRPHGSMVHAALEIDACLAAQLGARLEAHDEARAALRMTLAGMLSNPMLPVRCRGALAALQSRDPTLLPAALDILTETRKGGVYLPSFGEVFDLDYLFAHRGTLGAWLGATGTDQLLEVIAEHGDERWSSWLDQMATAGKLTVQLAVSTALACDARISPWTAPHLSAVADGSAHLLRSVAKRGSNIEFARWLADHYEECVEGEGSGWFDINGVVVACGDDGVFARLLERFDGMSPPAQERLGFAVVKRGDPWLGRFQERAFAVGSSQHHHQLAAAVSLGIDDDTARAWIRRGPSVLGWRVLVERHQNAAVPELVAALPNSFENVHSIPALKAIRFLAEPPDTLADEVWSRVRGTMTPMAMEDVLYALAPIRARGVPSVVGQLARNPFFLPGYHLARFLELLRKWQAETGLTFRVKEGAGDLGFVEWLLMRRLPSVGAEAGFSSRLRPVQAMVVPILLAHFEDDPETCMTLIAEAGAVGRFHSALVEHLLAHPGRAALIPTLFATCMDTFPEQVLLRVLDAPGIDFRGLLGAIAASSTPTHMSLHVAIARRALENGLDLWAYRDVAQALRVHPRAELGPVLQEATAEGVENGLWLIREVETACGELLVNERGEWLV